MKKLILKKKVVADEATPIPATKAGAYVGRSPSTCKVCKHLYMDPCHGERPLCGNLAFLKGTAASQA